MFVSIVIPNYNRSTDIFETLKSVSMQNYLKKEIIVVDDNSTDNSISIIKKNFNNVEIIESKKNNGPAIARNIGIENSVGDIIIGIDSDVVIKDIDLINKVINIFLKNESIHCIAFRILKYENEKEDVERWWHPVPIAMFFNKPFYTNYFSGTGFAFKKEVLIDVGMFPDYLYMFNEEVDLSFRLLEKNYNIYYDPSVVVYHKASKIGRNNMISEYYKCRNQIWLVIRYYPIIRGIIYIVPRIIYHLFLSIQNKSIKIYLKSIKDSLSEFKTNYRFRRPIKKNIWKKIEKIKSGKYTPK